MDDDDDDDILSFKKTKATPSCIAHEKKTGKLSHPNNKNKTYMCDFSKSSHKKWGPDAPNIYQSNIGAMGWCYLDVKDVTLWNHLQTTNNIRPNPHLRVHIPKNKTPWFDQAFAICVKDLFWVPFFIQKKMIFPPISSPFFSSKNLPS